MVLLSSLMSRDRLNWYHGTQIPPQWLNQPITIFHPRDGKSPLARLPLAPWLLARHLVRACSDNKFRPLIVVHVHPPIDMHTPPTSFGSDACSLS